MQTGEAKMGGANRILAIVAMILAVVAVILSFLLFQRRAEFRQRADKLAATVADMVKSLDQDSGTVLTKDFTFTPADKANGIKEDGSLAAKAFRDAKGEDGQYAAFQAKLDQAKELAKNLNAQRNALATKLAEAGVTLGMTDTEAAAADLKAVKKGAEVAGRVAEHATAIRTRDDLLLNAVITSSKTIGHPVDEKALRERAQTTDAKGNVTKGAYVCGPVLGEYDKNVTNLNTRATDYANTLTQEIDRIAKLQWTTDKNVIKDEKEYSGAMTTLLNDFDDINQKLVQLEETKAQLEEKLKELKAMSMDLEKSKEELDKTKGRLSEIEGQLKKLAQSAGVSGSGDFIVNPNLEGAVMQIDREWSFVILNLGADKVRENMEFLVVRDGNYVAKVMVSKAYPRFSIAEVLPEGKIKDIQANDKVILPKR
jgi:DNA repair exonuclease SbcCD ATPase subunit